MPQGPAPVALAHPLLLAKGVSRSLPNVVGVEVSGPFHPRPKATFIPTTANLQPPEANLPPQLDFQAMFSSALSSLFAASLHHASHLLPQPPVPQGSQEQRPPQPHTSQDQADSSEESEQAEDDHEDIAFSDDEGLLPDALAFSGLFRPALFKSLLQKAHLMTNLGVPGETQGPQTSAGPHDALFKTSVQEKDFIPCPQLFADFI